MGYGMTEKEIELLLSKMSHIFDMSRDGSWFMGRDRVIRHYNQHFYSQFDLPSDEVTLDQWLALVHPIDKAQLSERVDEHEQGDSREMVTEYRVKTKNNGYIWLEATGVIIADEEGSYMVGSHRDISEQKLLREYFYRVAYHDGDTGLYNRLKWIEDIEHNEDGAVLITVSVDNFKDYDRLWGGSFAKEVVARLVKWVNEQQSDYEIYRVSETQFVLRTLSGLSVEALTLALKSLLEAFNDDIYVDEHLLTDDVSVGGLYECDLDRDSPLSLLYQITDYASDNGGVTVYQGDVKNAIDRWFVIKDSIRSAIENEDITIAVQPIFDSVTNQIISYEALARWTHQDLGYVSPVEFIPLAEQRGLITVLGKLVFRKACEFVRRCPIDSDNRPKVNINVSVIQLRDPDFVTDIVSIANQYKVPTSRIVLELTESHILDSSTVCHEQISKAKQAGFEISLDDFGAGYSSIISLFRQPLNQIKLDKSLVEDCQHDASCRNLVTYLVQLCKDKGMSLVSEGIESAEMQAFMQELGASHLQGFGLGKPKLIDAYLHEESTDELDESVE